MAELRTSAGPGQPRWGQGVTWGPRSAQHALRPQKARPARAHDGAATGRQKQARPSEVETLRGHSATFTPFSWQKRNTDQPETWWGSTDRVNGQRPRRRCRIEPGLALAWSLARHGADMTAWAIGRLRAPLRPTLPWSEAPWTPLGLHPVASSKCPSRLPPRMSEPAWSLTPAVTPDPAQGLCWPLWVRGSPAPGAGLIDAQTS